MKATDRFNVRVVYDEKKYTSGADGVVREETFGRVEKDYSMVNEDIRAAIQSELVACLERLDALSHAKPSPAKA